MDRIYKIEHDSQDILLILFSSCKSCLKLTSKQQPQPDLHAARIVRPNTLKPEVERITQIRRREKEIGAIEQIERLRAEFKRHRLRYVCLLQDTHVFTRESRRVDVAQRRCERTEEPQRIGVISRVSSRADRRAARIVVEAGAKLR